MAKAMGAKKKPMAMSKDPERKYLCPYCNKEKPRSGFYVSSDPLVLTGLTNICKECAEKIARGYNPTTGNFSDVTKQSLCAALERMDKPFIQKLYDSSYDEVHDDSLVKNKTNLWAAYIKNVQMIQYRTMRWRDGDLFKDNHSGSDNSVTTVEEKDINPEVLSELEKNRKDVVRMIGYDPFEKEAADDKPLLYAQLIGYLDSDGNNDDMTRVLDSIEIVRGYLQLQKLNDMSAQAFANLAKTGQSGEIKNYMDTKKRVADVISQLAQQSCISLKHNKNAKKGENTWTGKIKKLKELNLREAEVNGFDIGTCRGMQQVLELSDASIMKQLHLDESEWSDMVAEQRSKIVKLQSERDIYKEINRILLRENIDLRDTLSENDMLDEANLQNLKELFSAFSDIAEDDENIDKTEDISGEEDVSNESN